MQDRRRDSKQAQFQTATSADAATSAFQAISLTPCSAPAAIQMIASHPDPGQRQSSSNWLHAPVCTSQALPASHQLFGQMSRLQEDALCVMSRALTTSAAAHCPTTHSFLQGVHVPDIPVPPQRHSFDTTVESHDSARSTRTVLPPPTQLLPASALTAPTISHMMLHPALALPAAVSGSASCHTSDGSVDRSLTLLASKPPSLLPNQIPQDSLECQLSASDGLR
jgi:hypothetical protein